MSIMYGIEYVGYIDPWTDEERLTDEEVVRCRYCRWYEDGICHQPDGDGGLLCWKREPDGFCAWGERRDG